MGWASDSPSCQKSPFHSIATGSDTAQLSSRLYALLRLLSVMWTLDEHCDGDRQSCVSCQEYAHWHGLERLRVYREARWRGLRLTGL